jgi:hypothetical protein
MSSGSVAVGTILLSSAFISFGAYAQQTPDPAEPQAFGAIYYLDTVNKTLKDLPKEPAHSMVRTSFAYAIGVVQIPGLQSSFRLKPAGSVEFVIRIASGVDPEQYVLYGFRTRKKKREAETAKARSYATLSQTSTSGIPRDTFKYGESSYRYVFKALAPGEYAFVANNQAFSFAVDPR